MLKNKPTNIYNRNEIKTKEKNRKSREGTQHDRFAQIQNPTRKTICFVFIPLSVHHSSLTLAQCTPPNNWKKKRILYDYSALSYCRLSLLYVYLLADVVDMHGNCPNYDFSALSMVYQNIIVIVIFTLKYLKRLFCFVCYFVLLLLLLQPILI